MFLICSRNSFPITGGLTLGITEEEKGVYSLLILITGEEKGVYSLQILITGATDRIF
jgi:hypothetical protein